MAAPCVVWRVIISDNNVLHSAMKHVEVLWSTLKHFIALVTIARHATQRTAIMETGLNTESQKTSCMSPYYMATRFQHAMVCILPTLPTMSNVVLGLCLESGGLASLVRPPGITYLMICSTVVNTDAFKNKLRHVFSNVHSTQIDFI